MIQRIQANGTASPQYRYDAFGNQIEPVETDPNPFRYCGEYWDGESKTYYLRARSYNPRTGRFVQEDPAKEGLNWYAYCEHNPVMFIDPTGLSWEEFWNDAKAFGYNFYDSQMARWEKAFHSPGEFIDWATYGIIGSSLDANASRYEAMLDDPSWYSIGNYASSGLLDMIDGTFNNSNPLSFDHWVNSFGTAMMLTGFIRAGMVDTTGRVQPPRGANFNILDPDKIFLPEEYYTKLVDSHLPHEIGPGIDYLYRYDADFKVIQVKFYDHAGRQTGWVDLTNHGYPLDHSIPHWHQVIYNAQYPDGFIIDHRFDPTPPFYWE